LRLQGKERDDGIQESHLAEKIRVLPMDVALNTRDTDRAATMMSLRLLPCAMARKSA
jgi:hypothetical protein